MTSFFPTSLLVAIDEEVQKFGVELKPLKEEEEVDDKMKKPNTLAIRLNLYLLIVPKRVPIKFGANL